MTSDRLNELAREAAQKSIHGYVTDELIQRIVTAIHTALTEAGVCPECGGSRVIDSGGATPWGSGINIPCPSCEQNSNRTLQQELSSVKEMSEKFKQTIRDREANELKALAEADNLRAELAAVKEQLKEAEAELALQVKAKRLIYHELTTERDALKQQLKDWQDVAAEMADMLGIYHDGDIMATCPACRVIARYEKLSGEK